MNIPYDKKLHLAAGFVIGGLAALYFKSPTAALVFSLIAGVAKEGYDAGANALARKKGLPPPHGVELYDALATVIGGVGAYIVYFVLRGFA